MSGYTPSHTCSTVTDSNRDDNTDAAALKAGDACCRFHGGNWGPVNTLEVGDVQLGGLDETHSELHLGYDGKVYIPAVPQTTVSSLGAACGNCEQVYADIHFTDPIRITHVQFNAEYIVGVDQYITLNFPDGQTTEVRVRDKSDLYPMEHPGALSGGSCSDAPAGYFDAAYSGRRLQPRDVTDWSQFSPDVDQKDASEPRQLTGSASCASRTGGDKASCESDGQCMYTPSGNIQFYSLATPITTASVQVVVGADVGDIRDLAFFGQVRQDVEHTGMAKTNSLHSLTFEAQERDHIDSLDQQTATCLHVTGTPVRDCNGKYDVDPDDKNIYRNIDGNSTCQMHWMSFGWALQDMSDDMLLEQISTHTGVMAEELCQEEFPASGCAMRAAFERGLYPFYTTFSTAEHDIREAYAFTRADNQPDITDATGLQHPNVDILTDSSTVWYDPRTVYESVNYQIKQKCTDANVQFHFDNEHCDPSSSEEYYIDYVEYVTEAQCHALCHNNPHCLEYSTCAELDASRPDMAKFECSKTCYDLVNGWQQGSPEEWDGEPWSAEDQSGVIYNCSDLIGLPDSDPLWDLAHGSDLVHADLHLVTAREACCGSPDGGVYLSDEVRTSMRAADESSFSNETHNYCRLHGKALAEDPILDDTVTTYALPSSENFLVVTEAQCEQLCHPHSYCREYSFERFSEGACVDMPAWAGMDTSGASGFPFVTCATDFQRFREQLDPSGVVDNNLVYDGTISASEACCSLDGGLRPDLELGMCRLLTHVTDPNTNIEHSCPRETQSNATLSNLYPYHVYGLDNFKRIGWTERSHIYNRACVGRVDWTARPDRDLSYSDIYQKRPSRATSLYATRADMSTWIVEDANALSSLLSGDNTWLNYIEKEASYAMNFESVQDYTQCSLIPNATGFVKRESYLIEQYQCARLTPTTSELDGNLFRVDECDWLDFEKKCVNNVFYQNAEAVQALDVSVDEAREACDLTIDCKGFVQLTDGKMAFLKGWPHGEEFDYDQSYLAGNEDSNYNLFDSAACDAHIEGTAKHESLVEGVALDRFTYRDTALEGSWRTVHLKEKPASCTVSVTLGDGSNDNYEDEYNGFLGIYQQNTTYCPGGEPCYNKCYDYPTEGFLTAPEDFLSPLDREPREFTSCSDVVPGDRFNGTSTIDGTFQSAYVLLDDFVVSCESAGLESIYDDDECQRAAYQIITERGDAMVTSDTVYDLAIERPDGCSIRATDPEDPSLGQFQAFTNPKGTCDESRGGFTCDYRRQSERPQLTMRGVCYKPDIIERACCSHGGGDRSRTFLLDAQSPYIKERFPAKTGDGTTTGSMPEGLVFLDMNRDQEVLDGLATFSFEDRFGTNLTSFQYPTGEFDQSYNYVTTGITSEEYLGAFVFLPHTITPPYSYRGDCVDTHPVVTLADRNREIDGILRVTFENLLATPSVAKLVLNAEEYYWSWPNADQAEQKAWSYSSGYYLQVTLSKPTTTENVVIFRPPTNFYQFGTELEIDVTHLLAEYVGDIVNVEFEIEMKQDAPASNDFVSLGWSSAEFDALHCSPSSTCTSDPGFPTFTNTCGLCQDYEASGQITTGCQNVTGWAGFDLTADWLGPNDNSDGVNDVTEHDSGLPSRYFTFLNDAGETVIWEPPLLFTCDNLPADADPTNYVDRDGMTAEGACCGFGGGERIVKTFSCDDVTYGDVLFGTATIAGTSCTVENNTCVENNVVDASPESICCHLGGGDRLTPRGDRADCEKPSVVFYSQDEEDLYMRPKIMFATEDTYQKSADTRVANIHSMPLPGHPALCTSVCNPCKDDESYLDAGITCATAHYSDNGAADACCKYGGGYAYTWSPRNDNSSAGSLLPVYADHDLPWTEQCQDMEFTLTSNSSTLASCSDVTDSTSTVYVNGVATDAADACCRFDGGIPTAAAGCDGFYNKGRLEPFDHTFHDEDIANMFCADLSTCQAICDNNPDCRGVLADNRQQGRCFLFGDGVVTTKSVCEDDLTYRDAYGHLCASWTQWDCDLALTGNPTSGHPMWYQWRNFNQEQLQDLLNNCPKACDLCYPEMNPSAVITFDYHEKVWDRKLTEQDEPKHLFPDPNSQYVRKHRAGECFLTVSNSHTESLDGLYYQTDAEEFTHVTNNSKIVWETGHDNECDGWVLQENQNALREAELLLCQNDEVAANKFLTGFDERRHFEFPCHLGYKSGMCALNHFTGFCPETCTPKILQEVAGQMVIAQDLSLGSNSSCDGDNNLGASSLYNEAVALGEGMPDFIKDKIQQCADGDASACWDDDAPGCDQWAKIFHDLDHSVCFHDGLVTTRKRTQLSNPMLSTTSRDHHAARAIDEYDIRNMATENVYMCTSIKTRDRCLENFQRKGNKGSDCVWVGLAYDLTIDPCQSREWAEEFGYVAADVDNQETDPHSSCAVSEYEKMPYFSIDLDDRGSLYDLYSVSVSIPDGMKVYSLDVWVTDADVTDFDQWWENKDSMLADNKVARCRENVFIDMADGMEIQCGTDLVIPRMVDGEEQGFLNDFQPRMVSGAKVWLISKGFDRSVVQPGDREEWYDTVQLGICDLQLQTVIPTGVAVQSLCPDSCAMMQRLDAVEDIEINEGYDGRRRRLAPARERFIKSAPRRLDDHLATKKYKPLQSDTTRPSIIAQYQPTTACEPYDIYFDENVKIDTGTLTVKVCSENDENLCEPADSILRESYYSSSRLANAQLSLKTFRQKLSIFPSSLHNDGFWMVNKKYELVLANDDGVHGVGAITDDAGNPLTAGLIAEFDIPADDETGHDGEDSQDPNVLESPVITFANPPAAATVGYSSKPVLTFNEPVTPSFGYQVKVFSCAKEDCTCQKEVPDPTASGGSCVSNPGSLSASVSGRRLTSQGENVDWSDFSPDMAQPEPRQLSGAAEANCNSKAGANKGRSDCESANTGGPDDCLYVSDSYVIQECACGDADCGGAISQTEPYTVSSNICQEYNSTGSLVDCKCDSCTTSSFFGKKIAGRAEIDSVDLGEDSRFDMLNENTMVVLHTAELPCIYYDAGDPMTELSEGASSEADSQCFYKLHVPQGAFMDKHCQETVERSQLYKRVVVDEPLGSGLSYDSNGWVLGTCTTNYFGDDSCMHPNGTLIAEWGNDTVCDTNYTHPADSLCTKGTDVTDCTASGTDYDCSRYSTVEAGCTADNFCDFLPIYSLSKDKDTIAPSFIGKTVSYNYKDDGDTAPFPSITMFFDGNVVVDFEADVEYPEYGYDDGLAYYYDANYFDADATMRANGALPCTFGPSLYDGSSTITFTIPFVYEYDGDLYLNYGLTDGDADDTMFNGVTSFTPTFSNTFHAVLQETGASQTCQTVAMTTPAYGGDANLEFTPPATPDDEDPPNLLNVMQEPMLTSNTALLAHPKPDEVDVQISSTFSLHFDEVVQGSAGKVYVREVGTDDGPQVTTDTDAVQFEGTVAHVILSQNLKPNTHYTLTFEKRAFRDLAGNDCENNLDDSDELNYRFTTLPVATAFKKVLQTWVHGADEVNSFGYDSVGATQVCPQADKNSHLADISMLVSPGTTWYRVDIPHDSSLDIEDVCRTAPSCPVSTTCSLPRVRFEEEMSRWFTTWSNVTVTKDMFLSGQDETVFRSALDPATLETKVIQGVDRVQAVLSKSDWQANRWFTRTNPAATYFEIVDSSKMANILVVSAISPTAAQGNLAVTEFGRRYDPLTHFQNWKADVLRVERFCFDEETGSILSTCGSGPSGDPFRIKVLTETEASHLVVLRTCDADAVRPTTAFVEVDTDGIERCYVDVTQEGGRVTYDDTDGSWTVSLLEINDDFVFTEDIDMCSDPGLNPCLWDQHCIEVTGGVSTCMCGTGKKEIDGTCVELSGRMGQNGLKLHIIDEYDENLAQVDLLNLRFSGVYYEEAPGRFYRRGLVPAYMTYVPPSEKIETIDESGTVVMVVGKYNRPTSEWVWTLERLTEDYTDFEVAQKTRFKLENDKFGRTVRASQIHRKQLTLPGLSARNHQVLMTAEEVTDRTWYQYLIQPRGMPHGWWAMPELTLFSSYDCEAGTEITQAEIYAIEGSKGYPVASSKGYDTCNKVYRCSDGSNPSICPNVAQRCANGSPPKSGAACEHPTHTLADTRSCCDDGSTPDSRCPDGSTPARTCRNGDAPEQRCSGSTLQSPTPNREQGICNAFDGDSETRFQPMCFGTDCKQHKQARNESAYMTFTTWKPVACMKVGQVQGHSAQKLIVQVNIVPNFDATWLDQRGKDYTPGCDPSEAAQEIAREVFECEDESCFPVASWIGDFNTSSTESTFPLTCGVENTKIHGEALGSLTTSGRFAHDTSHYLDVANPCECQTLCMKMSSLCRAWNYFAETKHCHLVRTIYASTGEGCIGEGLCDGTNQHGWTAGALPTIVKTFETVPPLDTLSYNQKFDLIVRGVSLPEKTRNQRIKFIFADEDDRGVVPDNVIGLSCAHPTVCSPPPTSVSDDLTSATWSGLTIASPTTKARALRVLYCDDNCHVSTSWLPVGREIGELQSTGYFFTTEPALIDRSVDSFTMRVTRNFLTSYIKSTEWDFKFVQGHQECHIAGFSTFVFRDHYEVSADELTVQVDIGDLFSKDRGDWKACIGFKEDGAAVPADGWVPLPLHTSAMADAGLTKPYLNVGKAEETSASVFNVVYGQHAMSGTANSPIPLQASVTGKNIVLRQESAVILRQGGCQQDGDLDDDVLPGLWTFEAHDANSHATTAFFCGTGMDQFVLSGTSIHLLSDMTSVVDLGAPGSGSWSLHKEEFVPFGGDCDASSFGARPNEDLSDSSNAVFDFDMTNVNAGHYDVCYCDPISQVADLQSGATAAVVSTLDHSHTFEVDQRCSSVETSDAASLLDHDSRTYSARKHMCSRKRENRCLGSTCFLEAYNEMSSSERADYSEGLCVDFDTCVSVCDELADCVSFSYHSANSICMINVDTCSSPELNQVGWTHVHPENDRRACSKLSHFSKYVGSVSATRHVGNVDWILAPNTPGSIEITGPAAAGDLNRLRDRIMIIPCSETCGIDDPAKQVVGTVSDIVPGISFVDRPAQDNNYQHIYDDDTDFAIYSDFEKHIRTKANHYDIIENAYLPSCNIHPDEHLYTQPFSCHNRCSAFYANDTDAPSYCDGYMPGYDSRRLDQMYEDCEWSDRVKQRWSWQQKECIDADLYTEADEAPTESSDVFCATAADLKLLCDLLGPDCASFEVHRTLPRGYLNHADHGACQDDGTIVREEGIGIREFEMSTDDFQYHELKYPAGLYPTVSNDGYTLVTTAENPVPQPTPGQSCHSSCRHCVSYSPSSSTGRSVEERGSSYTYTVTYAGLPSGTDRSAHQCLTCPEGHIFKACYRNGMGVCGRSPGQTPTCGSTTSRRTVNNENQIASITYHYDKAIGISGVPLKEFMELAKRGATIGFDSETPSPQRGWAVEPAQLELEVNIFFIVINQI